MKIIQIMSVSVVVAVLQSSPLPADDGYGTPDPSWYNQGSGIPRYDDSTSPPPGTQGGASGSSWYSSDWYPNQPGGRSGSERGWESAAEWGAGRGADTWSSESPARGDLPAAEYADPGYGSDLWRRDQQPTARDYPAYQGQPGIRSDPFADRQGAEPYAGPYDDAGRRIERDAGYAQGWRQPPARPEYRFREDPRLETPAVGGDASGYQFRPLTERERERHRESANSAQFAPRDDRRRQRARRTEDRGDAFGYQPDTAPGSFYERYYRTEP